jgi:hypothetical protein
MALKLFPLYAILLDVSGCREIAKQSFAGAFLVVYDDVVSERGRLCLGSYLRSKKKYDSLHGEGQTCSFDDLVVRYESSKSV